jgi:hypothetical protein
MAVPNRCTSLTLAVLTLDHGTIASTDIRLRLMPSDTIIRDAPPTRPMKFSALHSITEQRYA